LRGKGRFLGSALSSSTFIGRPVRSWHAAIAGAAGGYYIWGGSKSRVNTQVLLYLLSRVLLGGMKSAAKNGVKPFANFSEDQVYPFFAAGVWSAVMYLFESDTQSLQTSLVRSMDEIYRWKIHVENLSRKFRFGVSMLESIRMNSCASRMNSFQLEWALFWYEPVFDEDDDSTDDEIARKVKRKEMRAGAFLDAAAEESGDDKNIKCKGGDDEDDN
jgi:hypothetical protein